MSAIAPELINLATLPSIALENRKTLPECSCIYIARSREEILYIGRAGNLFKRWRQHHRKAELEAFFEVSLAWIEVSDSGLLPAIEKALIEYFKPRLNNQIIKVRKSKRLSNCGRPLEYGEEKKRRTLTVTESGWENIQVIAKNSGCNSVSDLLEKMARGQISLSQESV